MFQIWEELFRLMGREGEESGSGAPHLQTECEERLIALLERVRTATCASHDAERMSTDVLPSVTNCLKQGFEAAVLLSGSDSRLLTDSDCLPDTKYTIPARSEEARHVSPLKFVPDNANIEALTLVPSNVI